MLWSDWLPVTTPAVSVSLADFDAALIAQVTTVQDYLDQRINAASQLIAAAASNNMANTWLDNMRVRTETETAFAGYRQIISAEVGATNASVAINASAVATLEGYAAAQYSVTLDVNGYATGFELINGGPGVSATTFVTDKFQIAAPGITGGAATPIFTVANVNGSPKVAIRADDFLVDGTVIARNIAAGTITAIKIAAGEITSDSGVIGVLGVESLSIGDFAVVVPVAETRSDPFGTTSFLAVSDVTLSFDTTGLSGKSLTIIAGWTGSIAYTGAGAPTARLKIDGNIIQTVLTGTSAVQFFALTGSHTFTASGGAQNIDIVIEWQSGANATLGARTLWAMVGKR